MKPFYVDFESPPYVNVFAKAVRRVRAQPEGKPTTLRVAEMLPTPEQAWLPDARGRRYTTELRLAAFDVAPMRPAARAETEALADEAPTRA
jgi:hypothetical protein